MDGFYWNCCDRSGSDDNGRVMTRHEPVVHQPLAKKTKSVGKQSSKGHMASVFRPKLAELCPRTAQPTNIIIVYVSPLFRLKTIITVLQFGVSGANTVPAPLALPLQHRQGIHYCYYLVKSRFLRALSSMSTGTIAPNLDHGPVSIEALRSGRRHADAAQFEAYRRQTTWGNNSSLSCLKWCRCKNGNLGFCLIAAHALMGGNSPVERSNI